MSTANDRFLKILVQVLNTFSSITHNRLLFFSQYSVIIDNKVITDFDEVDTFFHQTPFTSYVVFPFLMDDQLTGFFMMDIAKTDKNNIAMCGKYIESSLKAVAANQTIHILAPLEAPAIAKLTMLLNSPLFPAKQKTTATRALHLNQQPTKDERSDIDKNIQMALKYINQHIEDDLNLKNVADRVYLSPAYLSRIFKNNFNDNFINYINLQKIALAQKKLVFTDVSIHELAHQIGFLQTSYFTKIFKEQVGVTPSHYRKYNKGVQAIYTIPRDLSWRNGKSVYAVSREFFTRHQIPFRTRSTLGHPYIYSIADKADIANNAGWVYTVDCVQMDTPASKISVNDKSVIQWFYLT